MSNWSIFGFLTFVVGVWGLAGVVACGQYLIADKEADLAGWLTLSVCAFSAHRFDRLLRR